MRELLAVEVVYATTAQQTLIALQLPEPATVAMAIAASGLLSRCPGLDLATLSAGIFGNVCTLQHNLKQGDRIEIYRPLIRDPKEARRQRAAK
jgi:putative ubiquitin-RnfH superfamily antitoxin RatB of RatAB toxin-antitoxin module